jgi:hypothetical protein
MMIGSGLCTSQAANIVVSCCTGPSLFFSRQRNNSSMTDPGLTSDARRISQEEFVRKYPHPFLAITVEVEDEEAEFRTIAASEPVLPSSIGRTSYEESLARVVKRPGANNFSFITIGRAQNNDIIIGIKSVSKCHAVIQVTGAGFTIADAGSKNGTFLNQEMLSPHKHVAVNSGDEVTLPPRVTARFLDPERAYAWLRER